MRITKLHGLAILVTAGITGAIWYHHPLSPARGQEHKASPEGGSALQTDLDEMSLMLPWRRDVLVLTPWLAPIVWEGTFSRDILNAQYTQKNLVTGVVTFALKKHVQFIEGFISSANKYFLAGHQVNFYLFTDSPEEISDLQMAPENHLFVIPIQKHPRWQDVSSSRMDIISTYIHRQFQHEVDYLYSMDINTQLLAHVGVEIIDALVATISSWHLSPQQESQAQQTEPGAASPEGWGDFHYTASFYGGSVAEVYKLTRACGQGAMEGTENGREETENGMEGTENGMEDTGNGMEDTGNGMEDTGNYIEGTENGMEDTGNGMEGTGNYIEGTENGREGTGNAMGARWPDESHLNKYLLQHKPTRLLSPEYYWDTELSSSSIQVKRMCPVHRES